MYLPFGYFYCAADEPATFELSIFCAGYFSPHTRYRAFVTLPSPIFTFSKICNERLTDDAYLTASLFITPPPCPAPRPTPWLSLRYRAMPRA